MSTPQMSCPSIGTFYACGDGSKFVGCCQTNPCGSTGCAAGNLKSTAFDASTWGTIPGQQCNAGLLYTCAVTSPPFWGCCKSNPCSGSGCSATDLAGAFLSGNPSYAQIFLALNSSWESTVASSSIATTKATGTASMSSSSTRTAAPASTPEATNQSSPSIAGPVAGGVVGGLAVLVALILGILFLRRRRARLEASQPAPAAFEQPRFPMQQQDVTAAKEAPAVRLTAVGSPQPPYSPGPPSYNAHISYELPGAMEEAELDSGQRFHPYQPGRPQSPVA